jgi:hypothetical protein
MRLSGHPLTIERDPASDPARAARGQARRATGAWVLSGGADPVGALVAADLDGSLLLALPGKYVPPATAEVVVALADALAGPDSYRSLHTVRAMATHEPRHALRFRNRHPAAEPMLADGRLVLWHASPARVRLLIPAGDYVELDPAAYLLDPGSDPELTEKEQANLEHQNRDHLDINLQLATQILGEPGGLWLLTGLDPEGMDFVSGDRRCRLPFSEPARDRKSLGAAIKGHLQEARARLGIDWTP